MGYFIGLPASAKTASEQFRKGLGHMTPQEFPRAFAAAFGTQDADRLAGYLAPDAGVLSLTGAWTEGREPARAALSAEFSGIFARARLVTGRAILRDLAPGVAQLHQRFVVSGAQGSDGSDLPRFAAMLSAVLVSTPAGWHIASLTFSGLAE